MNWEAAGAIGEIIGALAVVFTIGFLAVQIRIGTRAIEQQNSLAEAEAMARSVELMGPLRHVIASDEKLTSIWIRGLRGEKLSEIESGRYNQLASSFCENLSVVYFHNLQSGRDDAANSLVKAQAENIRNSPGLRDIWETNPFFFDPGETGLRTRLIEELAEAEALNT